VKFSFRQILASAGGAVMAAVIASIFGVKGTIVGVAIGSAAATFGTTLVAQSIEHGRHAVKQVVVRVPDTSMLLRRMGGTRVAGVTESSPGESTALTEDTTTTAAHTDESVEMQAGSAAVVSETTEMAVTAAADPVTEQLPVTTESAEPGAPKRRFRWPAIAGTAAVVFVLSLMFVTAVELIAGQPLANLFGGNSKSHGPSVTNLFTPPPAPTPTTSTTTPTTSTTTSTSTTTTTTTVPNGSTTTTTGPGNTTTTGGSGTTTTSTMTGVTTTT
jgi:hypothetical protein